MVVDEDSDVVLKCEAVGKPKPRIKWRHLIPSGIKQFFLILIVVGITCMRFFIWN